MQSHGMNLKDLPPHEEVIGDNDNNRYLGVAYSDYKDKPAANALQFFNKLFSGDYKSMNNIVKVDRTLDSESEVQAFQSKDGDVIVVSWLKTTVPGRSGDQKDGMVKDNREETISINIPLALAGQAVEYDELGNEKEFSSLEKNNDNTVVKNLNLQGGGLTIIKIMK